jgi:hypothetical protein
MTAADPGYSPPPIEDEYETDVLPVRRRSFLSPVTAGLALCLVAAGAFIGGVEVQKASGGSSSSTRANGGRLAARSGGPGGGLAARSGGGSAKGGFQGPGAFAPGNTTAGLVTLIKGTTLYVTDLTGNTVKVKTAAGLQVSKTVTTSLKGIHPGDSVVVRGTKQKDGSYKASAVTIGTGGGRNGG